MARSTCIYLVYDWAKESVLPLATFTVKYEAVNYINSLIANGQGKSFWTSDRIRLYAGPDGHNNGQWRRLNLDGTKFTSPSVDIES